MHDTGCGKSDVLEIQTKPSLINDNCKGYKDIVQDQNPSKSRIEYLDLCTTTYNSIHKCFLGSFHMVKGG
jgi:hypothetical protein